MKSRAVPHGPARIIFACAVASAGVVLGGACTGRIEGGVSASAGARGSVTRAGTLTTASGSDGTTQGGARGGSGAGSNSNGGASAGTAGNSSSNGGTSGVLGSGGTNAGTAGSSGGSGGSGASGGGGSGGTGGGEPPAPIDSTGWTDLTKSADTKVIYVSSSSGDDSRDGSSESLAVATLARGYALLRSGSPDWLLLKAGDVWTKTFAPKWEKSGRSPTEKMVVSSYGTGATPLIRAPLDGNYGAVWIVDATSHLAIVGLAFRPAARIPGESDYDPSVVSKSPQFGISVYNGPSDILIEGCEIAYYSTNLQVESAGTAPSDVQVRRNVILDSYSDSTFGHSQGLYAEGVVRLTVEENIFDHNGWNETATNAEPTIYNHNLYLSSGSTGSTLRGNLSTRAGSMCFKIKAEHSAAENTALMVENNTCVEDAIGVSLGGNPPTGGLAYKNSTVRRNVFSALSYRPGGPATNCIGVDIVSSDGADVSGNFLLDTNCAGAKGVSIQDYPNKGVVVTNNVFHNWANTPVSDLASDQSGIMVTNNWIERPASEYVDGTRSVASYAMSLGFADAEALIAAARKNTKAAWHVELSGSAITDYIAAGFTRP